VAFFVGLTDKFEITFCKLVEILYFQRSMKYHFSTVFVFLFILPLAVMGKKKRNYTTRDIITGSDSLMRNQIGDSLFKYCKLESGSYYTYRKGNKLRFESFAEEKSLPKKFERAYIRYEFMMLYPECTLYDSISNIISVEVKKEDTLFRLQSAPDMSFIPEAALAHAPCTFISKEDAIKAALQDNIKRGVTPPNAVLRYIASSKQFVWIVLSLIWNEKDFNSDKKAKRDVVMIDAVSGRILKHGTMLYEQEVNEFYSRQ
jgi:hypothetical protein